MTDRELQEAIVADLTAELNITDGESKFSASLLTSKVKGAIREVKTARRYPASYSDARIERDMERFYTNILNIARYDYNQVGVEGQASYSVDGESVSYVDRNKFFYGVLPIGRTS